MAQQLATEYVKACLKMKEAEMSKLIQLSNEENVVTRVKIFENGNQKIVLQDPSGEELIMAFEPHADAFVSEGSYKVTTPALANFLRKAVYALKGDAIVNRIYADFTMMYFYENGIVVKIIEMTEHHEKTIYEYTNPTAELERVFQRRSIEAEIELTQQEINAYLDARIEADPAVYRFIDERLRKLAHKLFVLEA